MGKKKDLRTKVEEDHSEWAGAVSTLSTSELDTMILRFAKYREELIQFKEADEELKKAREVVKDLNAPHKDNLNINALKTKYLIMLLGEKGGNTSGTIK